MGLLLAGAAAWGTDLLLAFGLSADSFCACAVDAMDPRTKSKRWAWILLFALLFSSFHFLMPLLGYFFGYLFTDTLSRFAKWISFAILLSVGLKGLFETWREWHFDRMEKVASSCEFDPAPYLARMVDEGKDLKEIKREFKALGRKLVKGEAHGIESLRYQDHRECKALGVYLIHEARCLTKRKLEEILHPEAVEQNKKGQVLSLLSTVLLQAVATSLDALAVGFSYAGQTGVDEALVAFGSFFFVVFAMSALGGFLGKALGDRWQRVANALGAMVLIGLAIKALFSP